MMCTNFHVKAKDNSIVVGRSMDFLGFIDPIFYVQKRHSGPLFIGGGQWGAYSSDVAEYGYVGIAIDFKEINELPELPKFIMDGMNEHGLSAGILQNKFCQYPKEKTAEETSTYALFICSWVLGHCATVEEVKAKLPQRTFYDPFGIFYFYVAVVDKLGQSIVIHYDKGELVIYDNPVGVSANEPNLPTHLDLLTSYAYLSSATPAKRTIGSLKITPYGGGQLVGIPGDFTSPSRFVRTTYLKDLARTPQDSQEAYILATHLLNSVDSTKDVKVTSYTKWSVVKGLHEGVLALRTYDNMLYRAMNLSKIDFGSVSSQFIEIPRLDAMVFFEPE